MATLIEWDNDVPAWPTLAAQAAAAEDILARAARALGAAGSLMTAPFAASFAGAVLDAGAPDPDNFAARAGASGTRRFAVHRNNVVVGLVERASPPLSSDGEDRRRGMFRGDGARLRRGSGRRARRS